MAQAKHNLPETSNGTLKEKEKDSNEDKEGTQIYITMIMKNSQIRILNDKFVVHNKFTKNY